MVPNGLAETGADASFIVTLLLAAVILGASGWLLMRKHYRGALSVLAIGALGAAVFAPVNAPSASAEETRDGICVTETPQPTDATTPVNTPTATPTPTETPKPAVGSIAGTVWGDSRTFGGQSGVAYVTPGKRTEECVGPRPLPQASEADATPLPEESTEPSPPATEPEPPVTEPEPPATEPALPEPVCAPELGWGSANEDPRVPQSPGLAEALAAGEIEVVLLDANGVEIAQKPLNPADGTYRFDNVPVGDGYKVDFRFVKAPTKNSINLYLGFPYWLDYDADPSGPDETSRFYVPNADGTAGPIDLRIETMDGAVEMIQVPATHEFGPSSREIKQALLDAGYDMDVNPPLVTIDMTEWSKNNIGTDLMPSVRLPSNGSYDEYVFPFPNTEVSFSAASPENQVDVPTKDYIFVSEQDPSMSRPVSVVADTTTEAVNAEVHYGYPRGTIS
ncbi:hypothetical protein [Gulosibacter bifidus]|uniref:SD-repeat containing protein B domain-containing protein n=1 Tax=Gulosibacter bifidus TaxID=272239 RepID=A0ABW5RJN7_9MICO|nr:hypothetical protein [Gulosibacter bifidus]